MVVSQVVEQLEHSWTNQGAIELNYMHIDHDYQSFHAANFVHLLYTNYDIYRAFHRLNIQLPHKPPYFIASMTLEAFTSILNTLNERKAALEAQQGQLFRSMVVGINEMNAGLSEKRLKLRAQDERLQAQLADLATQVRWRPYEPFASILNFSVLRLYHHFF